MKTMTAVLIAMFITITANAETWRQKVARLERANRSLKSQVAALTKQVIKLQKENNAMMGDQEVPKEQVTKIEVKKTGKEYVIKSTGKRAEYIKGMLQYLEKYKKEKKEIEAKIKNQKYRLGKKSKLEKEKRKWLDQVAALEKKIKIKEQRIAMFDVKQ